MFWDQVQPGAPRAADEWFTHAFCGSTGGADLPRLPGRDLWGRTFFIVIRRIRLSTGVSPSGKLLAPVNSAVESAELLRSAVSGTVEHADIYRSQFFIAAPLSWSLGVLSDPFFLGGLGTYFLAHRWTQIALPPQCRVAFSFMRRGAETL